MKTRVWVLSELYYPDETATGYLLTGIAEGLSRYFPVHVLCSRLPRLGKQNIVENRNGVAIRRCLSTSLEKDVLVFRMVNLIVVSISIFWNAIRRIRRDDCVLVVTNPPTLPFLATAACRIRGAKCLLLIHDVYPEVLVATGLAKRSALFTRFLGWLNSRLYRGVDRIIVLGRDMRDLVMKKLPQVDRHVVIIQNWADHDIVAPAERGSNVMLVELGLLGKFVLQYAGNIGRTHGIETLFEAAKKLNGKERVHFLFLGSGAKRRWLESNVRKADLTNVTILPPQPRSNQNVFLNACDAAIVSFVGGMAGVSVPSRMYNILAAGKPIIAVADDDSELARVVREEGVGWVVPPDRVDRLVEVIREAASNPKLLAKLGTNARAVIEKKYSYELAIESYRVLISEFQNNADSVSQEPESAKFLPRMADSE